MNARSTVAIVGLAASALVPLFGQSAKLTVPASIEAGSAFSIPTSGNGDATLYIVGPGQALKRNLQLGTTVYFSAGSLYNAGQYLAVLSAQPYTDTSAFDVVPAAKPAEMSFLAKPSRLSVNLPNGITGAVYVFDAWKNLISAPMTVSFQLSNPSGSTATRTAVTRNGSAWIAMDSTPNQGIDKFVAHAGDVTNSRVIRQVAGDPCTLKMSARQAGQHIHLETEPVRDCNGNPVPDGTVVTFKEAYNGVESTVDVPLKRGIAQIEMPVHAGATISIASGVALGNQIRWEK